MSDLRLRTQRFAQQTEELDEKSFLKAAVKEFGQQLTFATSLGPEDQVLLHLLDSYPDLDVFTLDTGRLPQETYDVLAQNQKNGRRIDILFPEASAVQALVRDKGINLFYDGVAERKACCHIRKVQPLNAKLKGFTAWITGLRRQQSTTRTQMARVEYDESHDMVKLNPLIEWTREDIWEYLHLHKVPYNALHDQGYPSLGCAPCTRAVSEGEDERAGRWWWELPEHKECGLHAAPATTSKTIKIQGLSLGS